MEGENCLNTMGKLGEAYEKKHDKELQWEAKTERDERQFICKTK